MHFPCYYVRRKPVSQNMGVVHITNERFYIQRIPEEKNVANGKKRIVILRAIKVIFNASYGLKDQNIRSCAMRLQHSFLC